VRCLDDRIVYAVGDIHGRLDLFDILIEAVRADLEACAKPGVLIPLGDYLDRGPDCRGVVERLISLAQASWIKTVPLRGNHEQLLLDFLEHPESGRNWMTLGGAATLASYGVLPPRRNADGKDWIEVRNRLASALPRSHYRLLSTLPYCVSAGDYFFVHAGVRPDRPLNAQRQRDMLWIRDSFLREPDLGFDKVIVHGHSTSTEPMIERARIGIDTGAYATGVLTCLRLDGSSRALIGAEAKGVELMALPAF
jgi:serine/threonine protein phosphatase 1